MGTAGTLSINFVLPAMGRIFDAKKIEVAGGPEAFKALSGERLEQVLGLASQTSFRAVAVLPAILLIVFGAIWLYDRSKVFLHRAGTVILLVAIGLWALAHLPLENGKPPAIENSIVGTRMRADCSDVTSLRQ